MADKKDENKNKDDGKTTLSPEVAQWLASRDGYSTKDAAKDTGVSASEAQAAQEQAAKDDPSTN